MELTSFSECVVPVPFKRGGMTCELQVNIDAFTPEFFRHMKQRAEQKFKAFEAEIEKALRESKSKKPIKKPKRKAEEDFKAEMQEQLESIETKAQRLETERETNVEFLIPAILKGWDLVHEGEPIEPTAELLLKQPPRFVQELFDVCVKAAQTVKKTDDEEETPASMQDGSQGLRVVGQST